MHLAGFAVFFVNGADLPRDDEARRRFDASREIREAGRILQRIKTVLPARQCGTQFLPPGGMRKVPVPTRLMPLLAAQRSKCAMSQSRLVAREYFE